MLYTSVTDLIGDTPLLVLDPAVHQVPGVDLYAKLELLNPFGSVKDRVAWGMIRDDLPRVIAEGRRLVEASSGNTAKALQVLAAMHGLNLEVLTNRVKVPEVRDVLDLLGCTVRELPGLSECPDPTVPDDVFSTIESMIRANPDAYYHASQYTNEKNPQTHYETTGHEIFEDIGPVDYLFGGLGTTGSTRGAAAFLREKNPELRCVGIVSSRYDFIPGIRSETELWDVGLFDRSLYDAIIAVDSGEAVDATVDLARRHGILAGPTSGATYAAARQYFQAQPLPSAGRRKAVFIACDRIEWYLSYLRKRRPELFGLARRASLHDLPPDAAAPELSPVELDALRGNGHPLLVDTRGGMAYRIGHIPGAINIRDDHLDNMLSDGIPFPASSTVVFVCPVGEYAKRPAALLRAHGREAFSLRGGILAWRDAGLPMDSGTQ